jgi:2,4-dichlorophenol 6-monooxygenase
MAASVKTDVLIVGAGPAGAASAVFLGKYGIPNIMISRHRSTARTPRAHLTNQRTMEALRDAGLERECLARSSPGSNIEHTFWLRSMVGEELARCYAWGNDPVRKGDYETASPCRLCDLPQSELEPILVTAALRLGSHVRFGMELLSFQQDQYGVTALVRDRATGEDVEVHAKYMIGADGGRSRVVEQLGIPLIGRKGLGDVISVLCEVDLGDYLAHRHAALYQIVQPASSKWGPITNFRMVRPWDRWVVSLMRAGASALADPRPDEIEEQVRTTIGAPLPVKIVENVSVWSVNDAVASHYTVGRVLCMGDAVHRHPPGNGLGSNTSVQDAFNLAWKLAFVLQGKAGPRLLESFNAERQPVGHQVVARATKSMGLFWDAVNFMVSGEKGHSPAEYQALLGTPAGRAGLRRILFNMRYENHAHGVELNRQYVSGAVIDDGTPVPVHERDAELYYQPSTRPGSPLPHVWLGRRTPGPRLSSLDLAGKQRFTIFTGTDGERWREAARYVSQKIGMEIPVVSIGPFLDYEDLYQQWSALSEIDDSGCALIRPDLHVAWRCRVMPDDPAASLFEVMTSVLDLAGSQD